MRLTRHLAVLKQTLNYGKDWIMTVGMCYLIAGQLQNQLISKGIFIPIAAILPIGVIGTWLIGYLSIKWGVYSEEQRFSWDRNPSWTDREESKGELL